MKKSNLSEKNVIVEEELDRIDINDIVNLENSPKLVFIDEECANFIAVNDCRERTRNINRKKNSDVRREHLFSNHVILFYYRVNNLKDRKFFLIKRIEIALIQFLLGMTGVVPP